MSSLSDNFINPDQARQGDTRPAPGVITATLN